MRLSFATPGFLSPVPAAAGGPFSASMPDSVSHIPGRRAVVLARRQRCWRL